MPRTMSKGELMHRASGGCSGIVYVSRGQLRTYIVSEEGREVTLYRVRQGDICVLSASCLMDAIVFDVLSRRWRTRRSCCFPPRC